jgi:hypothetical protein
MLTCILWRRQGVDVDVLGDVVQLLLEIISTVLVQNLPVRWARWCTKMHGPDEGVWVHGQSNLRLLYVLMYEQDALDQLRDKYRFAPLLVNIDTVRVRVVCPCHPLWR